MKPTSIEDWNRQKGIYSALAESVCAICNGTPTILATGAKYQCMIGYLNCSRISESGIAEKIQLPIKKGALFDSYYWSVAIEGAEFLDRAGSLWRQKGGRWKLIGDEK